MSEATMQQVGVATKEHGTVMVDAEVYGLWALTPGINDDGTPNTDYWTFTHVPTGRTHGGTAFANKPETREFVKLLAREFTGPPWDGDNLDAFTNGEYAAEKKRFAFHYAEFRFGEDF